MEILLPIFQVGCASASAMVMSPKVVEIAPQKRSARGGQDDPLDLGVPAAAKRLMHGVVLGVDGEDLAAVLARGARHDVARGDEHFLVRDADALAGFQRGVDRRDAGGADDRGDDGIRSGERRHRRRSLGAADDLDVPFRRATRNRATSSGLRTETISGAIPLDLLREQIEIAARREPDHAQLVRKRVDDGERRAPDGTGAA